MNKLCPKCKNSLDESAFSWSTGGICNGCHSKQEAEVEQVKKSVCRNPKCGRKIDSGEFCNNAHCEFQPISEEWEKEFDMFFFDYKHNETDISTKLVTNVNMGGGMFTQNATAKHVKDFISQLLLLNNKRK